MVGFPKPEPRKKTKAREQRAQRKDSAAIRQYVFARERDLCRCCRKRLATSLHEIVPRSVGGKISKKNSIALCGDGVLGCHGFCQRWEIDICTIDDAIADYGAEGHLTFRAKTPQSADWMGVNVGDSIVSPPMFAIEAAE